MKTQVYLVPMSAFYCQPSTDSLPLSAFHCQLSNIQAELLRTLSVIVESLAWLHLHPGMQQSTPSSKQLLGLYMQLLTICSAAACPCMCRLQTCFCEEPECQAYSNDYKIGNVIAHMTGRHDAVCLLRSMPIFILLLQVTGFLDPKL